MRSFTKLAIESGRSDHAHEKQNDGTVSVQNSVKNGHILIIIPPTPLPSRLKSFAASLEGIDTKSIYETLNVPAEILEYSIGPQWPSVALLTPITCHQREAGVFLLPI